MKILLTCGIGDFIAIESLLTAEERRDVETIYWATPQEKACRLLVPFCFPNVKEHITLFDKFTRSFTPMACFASAQDVWQRGNNDAAIWNVDEVVDLSCRSMSNQYRCIPSERQFTGSSLCATPLADISRFKLEKPYVVLQAYSENARTEDRDLGQREWSAISAQRWQHGVVLGVGSQVMPPIAGVVDLMNRTTLLEALEIVKGAGGFIGCSSCFSVMAAKAGVIPLLVKGNESLQSKFWSFYYTPATLNPVHLDLRHALE